MSKTRVYMAGSRDVAGEANSLALLIEKDGATVVSQWHRGEPKLVDPTKHGTRAAVLESNLRDLNQAHVVVALMDRAAPKATYAEIGWALARGIPVVWIGSDAPEDPRSCIFNAHHLVLLVSSELEARRVVREISIDKNWPEPQ